MATTANRSFSLTIRSRSRTTCSGTIATLPRGTPDLPVLGHRDSDHATTPIEGALAHDLDPPPGRIDLVHLNDSRDAFGSGADRHANVGRGTIDADVLVGVCAAAGAPVVVETPAEGQAADIAFLRERLGS